MVDLTVLRDIVTIFGVIAGFTYYVLTVRNTNKNRELQLFMQLYSFLYEPNRVAMMGEITSEMEWTDFQDFERKYGTSTGNYENYGNRYSVWKYFDGIGELLRRGFIDPYLLYSLVGQSEAIWIWDKFGAIILEYRELLNLPEYFKGFEYLASEMSKIRDVKGHPTEIPEKYGSALLK